MYFKLVIQDRNKGQLGNNIVWPLICLQGNIDKCHMSHILK